MHPKFNKIYAKVKELIAHDVMENWFKEIIYEQIEVGVSYHALSQHKRGKVNDLVKYQQKMVRTEISQSSENSINTKPTTVVKTDKEGVITEIATLK